LTRDPPKVGTSTNRARVEHAERLQRQADLLLAQGHYAQAEALYRKASDIILASFGPVHSRYADSLDRLALAVLGLGRYREAATIREQVLDIQRAIAGEEDPAYLRALTQLASTYRLMGGSAEAENTYRRALERHRARPGRDPAGVVSILTELACLHAEAGKERETLTAISEAEQARNEAIDRVASRGSERDHNACIESLRGGFDLFLSLAARYFPDSPRAAEVLLTLVLQRKALGIEMSLIRRAARIRDVNPSIRSRLRKLRSLRQTIASKTLRILSAHDAPAGWRDELHNQRVEQRELEAAMAREVSGRASSGMTLDVIDARAVASTLPPGGALLEFVKYRRYDFASLQSPQGSAWREYRYAVFLLVPDASSAVRMVDLGEASEIDRLVARFRSWLASGMTDRARGLVSEGDEREDPCDSPGEALRAALFDPLRDALGGTVQLVLATDGELARIPLEALPLDDSGRYLLDRYRVRYLDTGRDLVRHGADTHHQASPPLVVADPKFDLRRDDQGSRRASFVQKLLAKWGSRKAGDAWREPASDGAAANHHERNGFEPLPGTRIEGELIAAMLGVPLVCGANALETRIKACASPRVFHLATHGFFLADPAKTTQAGEEGVRPPFFMENPLLRSGLALAGADHFFSPAVLPEEAEDGVLTAEDVTGLDLQATELVVLSACETGLGETRVGEGVFGLRRAFVLAGAKTLVMSLWRVADLPTAILMVTFYRNLIQARMPRDEALRQAKCSLRQLTAGQLREEWLDSGPLKSPVAGASLAFEQYLSQPATARPFEHPFFWGGFILLGQSAPLV
jgi:CHAT domain-containing protein/tetratricopeptide (TPR) repeat protein